MTVTLFTLDGTRMETDRVLEASADWQAGSPAAQFSAVLPGENWPEELVTVRWKDDSGFTLFEGYLDTTAQVLDSDGPRLEVTARSAGCYLLDNEALPQSYDSVTLDSFCQRYLDSYGIFRRGFSYRGRIPYTVPKGQSEWEALAGFVYALTGKFPYLSREGELCLLPRDGTAVQLSNTRAGGVRFLTRTLSERRSEPISKVLVRDKNGYYPTEFGDRRALELGHPPQALPDPAHPVRGRTGGRSHPAAPGHGGLPPGRSRTARPGERDFSRGPGTVRYRTGMAGDPGAVETERQHCPHPSGTG